MSAITELAERFQMHHSTPRRHPVRGPGDPTQLSGGLLSGKSALYPSSSELVWGGLLSRDMSLEIPPR
jgi:hypothetical protein